jgi:hypothetical protein
MPTLGKVFQKAAHLFFGNRDCPDRQSCHCWGSGTMGPLRPTDGLHLNLIRHIPVESTPLDRVPLFPLDEVKPGNCGWLHSADRRTLSSVACVMSPDNSCLQTSPLGQETGRTWTRRDRPQDLGGREFATEVALYRRPVAGHTSKLQVQRGWTGGYGMVAARLETARKLRDG